MTATQADMIAELRRANVALRHKIDGARAHCSGEHGKRVAHQAASIDVLKSMSVSPAEVAGLGLSIAYDIVTKAHDGTTAVDSEVRAFTEFVVTLPQRMFASEETTQ